MSDGLWPCTCMKSQALTLGAAAWPHVASSRFLIDVPAGTTDLGRGAIVAFHPAAWAANEAARLLQALQVGMPIVATSDVLLANAEPL